MTAPISSYQFKWSTRPQHKKIIKQACSLIKPKTKHHTFLNAIAEKIVTKPYDITDNNSAMAIFLNLSSRIKNALGTTFNPPRMITIERYLIKAAMSEFPRTFAMVSDSNIKKIEMIKENSTIKVNEVS